MCIFAVALVISSIIFGYLMLAFSGMSNIQDAPVVVSDLNAKTDDDEDLNLGTVILIVGLIILGISLIMVFWTFTVRLCMSKCWMTVWSITIFIYALALLIIGINLSNIKSIGKDYITSICNDD